MSKLPILLFICLLFGCRAPLAETETKDEDKPAIEKAVREFYSAPHKRPYPNDVEQPVNVIGIQIGNKTGEMRVIKVDLQTASGERQMRTVRANAFEGQNGKYWKVQE